MWSFWLAIQMGYNFGFYFAIQREGGIGVFPCLHENSGHESFEYLTRVKVLTDSPPPSLTTKHQPQNIADLLKVQLSSSKFMYKISILKYGRLLNIVIEIEIEILWKEL